jgi:hypothetical protein
MLQLCAKALWTSSQQTFTNFAATLKDAVLDEKVIKISTMPALSLLLSGPVTVSQEATCLHEHLRCDTPGASLDCF